MSHGSESSPTTADRLRAFVQGALGCTCPDALFASASIEFAPAAPGALFDIAVAGRLLVRCYRASGDGEAAASMAARVEAGRRERDAKGMNRFRLVLAAERPQPLLAAVRERFESARAGDDRVYLHVLDLAAIEPLFAVSC